MKVADGYARNYLLPRKLALLATEGNKKQVERERAKFEIKEAEEQKSAQAVADRMANVEVEISRKVGETEALYGSVTSADVADALAAKGFELDRRKLHLPDADQAARRVRGADQAASRRHREAQSARRRRRLGTKKKLGIQGLGTRDSGDWPEFFVQSR